MANYRIILTGFDGDLIGSAPITCSDDQEAFAKGKEMLRTFCAAVEVWDGSRKVGHLSGAADSPEGKCPRGPHTVGAVESDTVRRIAMAADYDTRVNVANDSAKRNSGEVNSELAEPTMG